MPLPWNITLEPSATELLGIIARNGPRYKESDKVKRLLVAILALVILGSSPVAFADKKNDTVTLSGWVKEIDPAAHTFAIQNGKKLLQFTIDPSRTYIQVDEWGRLQTSLGSVRVGAAAVVKVTLVGGRPSVEAVEFTHRPATGIPIKTRPGFVFSPYSHRIFDVRKCAHGDMIEEAWPGKIFLVPLAGQTVIDRPCRNSRFGGNRAFHVAAFSAECSDEARNRLQDAI